MGLIFPPDLIHSLFVQIGRVLTWNIGPTFHILTPGIVSVTFFIRFHLGFVQIQGVPMAFLSPKIQYTPSSCTQTSKVSSEIQSDP